MCLCVKAHSTGLILTRSQLTPWKKSYDNLNILKSRDITLLTNVHIVKAMVFPVVLYGCELDHKEV